MNDDTLDQPSKSQKKREADALQLLGKQLIDLDESILNKMPLGQELSLAILAAKRISSHGALRRQIQYIGKLMRTSDHHAIAAAFAEHQTTTSDQSAQLHFTELWRDKLIEGGAGALTEFIETFKPDDIQQLRQLIKKAQSNQNEAQLKATRKILFRFIRPYLNVSPFG